MKYIVYFLILITSFGINIPVVIQEDVYRDYQSFLAGRDPLAITDYSGEYSRRDVVEVVMIQQALYRGGLREFELEFIFTDSEGRDYALLRSGQAAMRGTAMWAIDYPQLEDYLYKSIEVAEIGKFEAGFYTEERRFDILEIEKFEDIINLKIVSSKSWTVDWLTLEQLGFPNRMDTAKWENMVKLVSNGRADVLLAPFQPNEAMSFEAYGYTLVPIKGVKIALEDPRIFAVAKNHPNGLMIIDALNKGLIEMKQEGLLDKIYIDSGFYNQRVKDWKLINDLID